MCSDNVTSPTARALLASDFHGRYSNSHGDGLFNGNKYIEQVDEVATELAKRLFGAGFVEIHSPSAMVACRSPILALAKPNDLITSLFPKEGGFPTVQGFQQFPSIVPSLRTSSLPFDANEMNIDTDAAIKQIRKEKPRIIVLGATVFLFPHPVAEIADVARETKSVIVYDAAQVFGLIAGKQFQQPFEEGADIVTGSTHKTLPGPQGGLVLVKNDRKMAEEITAVQHATTGCGQSNLWAAQAILFAEMLEFGQDYAREVVRSAKALAGALSKRGFSVVGEKKGFTESHMVVINVSKMGGSYAVGKILDKAGITATPSGIPGIDQVLYGGNISGLRFGPEEAVRIGMGVSEMDAAAEFVARALIEKEDPLAISRDIAEFRRGYQTIHYSFDEGLPAYAYPSAQ